MLNPDQRLNPCNFFFLKKKRGILGILRGFNEKLCTSEVEIEKN
jgi:hypothetical protein